MYKVLIVDDEQLIRSGMIARFQYLNFTFERIREAASGMEALALLEKEPAANVVPRPAPKWPICQNCGRPMVYCGEENTDGIVWKRYSCKDCYNQFCARRVMAGEETWPK